MVGRGVLDATERFLEKYLLFPQLIHLDADTLIRLEKLESHFDGRLQHEVAGIPMVTS